jgi:hypothetical protein
VRRKATGFPHNQAAQPLASNSRSDKSKSGEMSANGFIISPLLFE